MKLIIFFMLTLSISGFAYTPSKQEQCRALDFRADGLETVRDQKKISWCYAFSAADMLGYAFHASEPISAADIAVNYNTSDIAQLLRWFNIKFGSRQTQSERERFMMPHQNGFNLVALSKAMQAGYCPEKVFPSENWIKMTRVEDGWKESELDLKSAMLEIYALLKIKKELTIQNLPYYFHFKNIESPEVFLKLIKEQTLATFYGKLRKEVCKFDRVKFAEQFEPVMFMKDAEIFALLNRQLDRGRVVGIDYDIRLLSNHRHSSVKLDELHTSIVSARRWNEKTNQCQYLVRDSHGNQCNYDATYECLGGQVWIDEKLLYPNLVSLVYLKTK